MANKKFSKRKGASKPNEFTRKGPKNKTRDYETKNDVNSKIDKQSGFNDYSWYNKNPILLESAARIPFAVPTGGSVDAGTLYWHGTGSTFTKTSGSIKTSGVMTLDFAPAIGNSNSVDSPATIAAREIYAKVRKAYSGTLSVDAPDFMMYLLALDGIYSYIARLKRIYRTINVYSGVNKYTPEVLLGLNLGFSSSTQNGLATALDSLRTNKTKLWGGINTLISNVSKFTCPAVMDIFNRHYWMNDNYFMDRATRKAQIYMFRQSDYWKFSLDSEKRGSVITEEFNFSKAPAGTDVVDYLLNFGNTLLSALNDDEDAYTINGYLMRAFEGYPSFKIDDLKEDEVAEFVYSPEVLYQIHNAKVVPADYPVVAFATQTGTNSVVLSDPQFQIRTDSTAPGAALPNTILDVEMELPDMPTVVIASRLMYGSRVTANNENYLVHVYCGTEIVNSLSMATMHNNGWNVSEYRNNVLASDKLTATDMEKIARWSMFNLAPVITFWYVDTATNERTPLVLGDLTNPTTVDNEALIDLNRMCIYSEFNSFSI